MEETGQPLHYQAITKQILAKDLWQSVGKTPDRTFNTRLSSDINKKGKKSRFIRMRPGYYELRACLGTVDDNNNDQKFSFTDAVEIVLQKFANQSPMHYSDITDHILKSPLLYN